MIKTIYNEIGIGNQWFICHEIEDGDHEIRVKGLAKIKCDSVYLRSWIAKTVYILSTKNGFETKKKETNRFKILLGFSGIPK